MKKRILGFIFAVTLIFGASFALTTEKAYAAACEPGGAPNLNCPIWNVTVTFGWPAPTISCTTGGEYTCSSTPPKDGDK